MDDLTKQDSLELEVANFGPIVAAKIDLRPLTVFVGPSNTGKSYGCGRPLFWAGETAIEQRAGGGGTE